MKKLLLIASILVLSLSGCGSEWVAKIDGDKIELETFNSYYYAHHRVLYGKETTNEEIDKKAESIADVRRNPLLDKNRFLEELINTRLVLRKSEEDEYLKKNPDFKEMLSLYEEGLVANFYATDKFGDKLNITDEEIANVYNQQKSAFANRPIDQVEQYIRQQLTQQKFLKLGNELVDELKSNASITKNKEAIEKLSKFEELDPKLELFSIDDNKTNVEDFNKMYYSQLKIQYNTTKDQIDELRKNPEAVKQSPLLVPSNFIEQYIRTHLTAQKAKDDGFLDSNPELKTLIRMRVDNVKMQSFLLDKFKDEIKPTQQEIAAVYQKYSDRFTNVPVDRAEQVISQQIQKQKFQQSVQLFVISLKEESKIEKNKSLLEKKDSSETDKSEE